LNADYILHIFLIIYKTYVNDFDWILIKASFGLHLSEWKIVYENVKSKSCQKFCETAIKNVGFAGMGLKLLLDGSRLFGNPNESDGSNGQYAIDC